MWQQDRMGWQGARAASQRPLPKPIKMHAPVGTRPVTSLLMRNDVWHCSGCGYHVCCCAQKPVDENGNDYKRRDGELMGDYLARMMRQDKVKAQLQVQAEYMMRIAHARADVEAPSRFYDLQKPLR